MVDTAARPSPLAHALASVPVTEDIIEYTIACALALSPPEVRAYLREHMAPQVSAQARKIFGGDRVFIGKRSGDTRSERNAAIKRDYWQSGERIALLERRYGLSASHLWRIIKS